MELGDFLVAMNSNISPNFTQISLGAAKQQKIKMNSGLKSLELFSVERQSLIDTVFQ